MLPDERATVQETRTVVKVNVAMATLLPSIWMRRSPAPQIHIGWLGLVAANPLEYLLEFGLDLVLFSARRANVRG